MGKIWDTIKNIFFPKQKETVKPIFQQTDISAAPLEEEPVVAEEKEESVVEKEKKIWVCKIKVEKMISESEFPAYAKKGYRRGRKKVKKAKNK